MVKEIDETFPGIAENFPQITKTFPEITETFPKDKLGFFRGTTWLSNNFSLFLNSLQYTLCRSKV